MKKMTGAIIAIIIGFYGQAYCQNINVKQSIKNAKIAWQSIFPDEKCVIITESNGNYETYVYELKSLKCDIIRTDSLVNPFILTVKIDLEIWSSPEKKGSVEDALANVEEKGNRSPGFGTAERVLMNEYSLKDGKWILSGVNEFMEYFYYTAKTQYNKHINIEKIKSIPEE